MHEIKASAHSHERLPGDHKTPCDAADPGGGIAQLEVARVRNESEFRHPHRRWAGV